MLVTRGLREGLLEALVLEELVLEEPLAGERLPAELLCGWAPEDEPHAASTNIRITRIDMRFMSSPSIRS
jgi:hypothetical protein